MEQLTLADYVKIRKEQAARETQRSELLALIQSLLAPEKEKLMQQFAETEQKLLDTLLASIPSPIKGDKGDAPTTQELVKLIKPLIPKPSKGDDGKTPIKGVDYFDGKDAPEVDSLLALIEEKLPELIKKHAPQRNFSLIPRRSNSYFKVAQLTGTKDGSNKEFYLPEAPAFGTQIFVIMNGAVLELDRHFTVSGVTLNYSTGTQAPKSNWNHFAILYKN